MHIDWYSVPVSITLSTWLSADRLPFTTTLVDKYAHVNVYPKNNLVKILNCTHAHYFVPLELYKAVLIVAEEESSAVMGIKKIVFLSLVALVIVGYSSSQR